MRDLLPANVQADHQGIAGLLEQVPITAATLPTLTVWHGKAMALWIRDLLVETV